MLTIRISFKVQGNMNGFFFFFNFNTLWEDKLIKQNKKQQQYHVKSEISKKEVLRAVKPKRTRRDKDLAVSLREGVGVLPRGADESGRQVHVVHQPVVVGALPARLRHTRSQHMLPREGTKKRQCHSRG